MKEQKRFDFKRHALPPVSRKYLWRILLYIVLLSGVSYFAYFVFNMRENQKVDNIDEVGGVEIFIEDSTLIQ